MRYLFLKTTSVKSFNKSAKVFFSMMAFGLLFIVGGSTFVFAQTFSELEGAGLPGVFQPSAAWGDYDNDGDLDILLTGKSGSVRMSTIYTNDGDGTFTELEGAGLTGVDSSSAAWGDYDNDGDLDILLTGYTGSGRISKIYRNDDGNFIDIGTGLPGVSSSSVAWGDYDNDGDLDILLTGYRSSGQISTIYTNDGGGNFSELEGAGLTGVAGSTAWGDYDNDGDLDILLAGYTGSRNISTIYTNDGDGTFTELEEAGLTDITGAKVAWGDYDNDGDLDILLAGDTSPGRISIIYTNDGGGIFTELEGAGLTGVSGSTAWGDYDNDGDLDIFLTGSPGSGRISIIYTNDGDGIFTELEGAGLPGVFQPSAAWGDYDNDGDLDILLTGQSDPGLISTIYTNDASTANTVPQEPTYLTATPNNDEGSVAFSWNAATDNETPSEGLSYNVFIKENPTGTTEYIKSPMAQENDGWRKLPALGNAIQNPSYTWNVPKAYCGGTAGFTVRVQAIDHTYAGSEFSSEAGFNIDLNDTPSILYVDANATGGNDGSDWNNAFTNLQDALSYPCFAGEIRVAKGTYKPGTDESDSFQIPEGVTLLGGFDGTETTADERNWSENPTILSGDLDESGDASAGDHFQVVRILNNSVTIDGLIIENGYNNDTRYAAGIYNEGDNTTIKNSIIRDNTVEGNNENGIGGGFVNESGDTEFVNCLFYNNTAWNYGGALSIEGDTVTLTNCTITNNGAEERGGAVHFYNGSLNATNTIFADNTAPANGNINDDGGSGTGTLNYSLVYNGNVSSAINQTNPITGDPLFADPENGDYSLANTSPALNAGDNSAIPSGVISDLAGNARIYEGTPDPDVVDMGAYELQREPFSIRPDENNVLFVDNNVSSGDGSGNSWENAIPELADALKWARQQYEDDDTVWDSEPLQVWVAEGTYNPLYKAAEQDNESNPTTERDNAFVMVPDVELYGGFDPDNGITDLSHDRIFPTTNPGDGTILSGDLGDNDEANFTNYGENTYHVVLVPDVVNSGLLDGFTVRGGNGNGSDAIPSLGILFARYSGGGVFNRGTFIVRNGHITQNRVESGFYFTQGGGVSSPGNLTLRDVVVDENHSSGSGGGISIGDGSADIVNALVTGNTANQGAGLDIGSSTTLTNTTITANKADSKGGGLFINEGAVEAVNSIVWGNTASNEPEVVNMGLPYETTFTVGNSIVGGGTGGGLDEDPLFADPDNGDFTLQDTSTAINAGDNNAIPSGVTTDLAGNARIFDGAPDLDVVDMGAYEFQGEPITAPDPVVLSAPADEAANTGLTPEFSWESLDGADEYQVQVSENNDLSDPVIDESGLEQTTFEPSGDLDNSVTYYWRVRASNAAGDGEWSEVFSFTTLPESSAVVILTDPSDDSENVPLRPLFEWNPADGADSYDLVVSPNGDLSDPVVDEDEIDNTQFQTTDDLDFSTTYYWHVRGMNSGGPGQWSETFSFTTQARPEAADTRILLANTEIHTFTPADFGQDDNSFVVVIEDLPAGFNGTLELDNGSSVEEVSSGDKISIGDITEGDLIYTPVEKRYGYGYDSFEFSIKDNVGNPSDDSYTMSLDVAATSVELDYDGEGWRFLASPAFGETVGEFFEPIWTQGFDGSDSPGAEFTNIQTVNQEEYLWQPVESNDAELNTGDAVIAYVYGDDDNNGSNDGFPKTLTSSTENWMNLDGSYDEILAYDSGQQENDDSFTLWGNPHPIALDLCQADLNNIPKNAYLWNPSENGGNGDYVTLSCATDEVEIAPFQSVWLRITDQKNDLAIPTEAYMEGTTNGYFKQKQSEDQFLITMNLTSQDHQEDLFSTSTRILFDDEALTDSDLMDAPKLSSAGLANQYLSLYSLDGNDQPYALQALPAAMDEKVSIPLDIQTTESGRFTLDWDLPESHIFSGSYFLRDNTTGEVMELREGSTYSFEIDPSQAMKGLGEQRSAKSPKDFADLGKALIQPKETETTHPMSELSGPGVTALHTHQMNSEDTPRFELLITTAGVDGLSELGAVPEEFTLAQNYPNPFNPTTVINYQLPVSSEVRLEVYDMLGRSVATLVNEQVAAGRHTVNFDASRLSSGVYLYRLQAGSQIMTRKLTILK